MKKYKYTFYLTDGREIDNYCDDDAIELDNNLREHGSIILGDDDLSIIINRHAIAVIEVRLNVDTVDSTSLDPMRAESKTDA